MSIDLYNKLVASQPNLTAEELTQLRDSLGVNVYEQIDDHLKNNVAKEELLDYCTLLLHAAAHNNKDGSELSVEYDPESPITQFVSTYKIFDLDSIKLVGIVLKQELKTKRSRKANGGGTANTVSTEQQSAGTNGVVSTADVTGNASATTIPF